MHMFAVIHLAIAAAAAAATAATPASPVALPGCPSSCGDVSVPYPFGIGEGCYHSTGFNLTCDGGTQGRPRLLLGTDDSSDGSFRVTGISIQDATVSVQTLLNAALEVDGDAVTWGEGLGANGPFSLSYERNEFTLMGCNVEAVLVGGGDGARCASYCNREGPALYVWDLPRDKCCGMGCCRAPIAMGRSSYAVRLRWLYPDHEHDAETPVSVFVAEKNWFRRSMVTMVSMGMAEITHTDWGDPSWFEIPQLRKEGNQTAPVVLDWAVPWPPRQPGPFRGGSWTCSEDAAGGLCRSINSFCVDVTSSNSTRSGYVCKCQVGYEGNPYLRDGCQDIDECRIPENCYGRCTNTPGGYSCGCPRGTLGDPYKRNGCAYSLGLSIFFGISGAGGLVLMVLSVIFLKQRIKAQRKKRVRQRFFNQNRGQLLLQMVSPRADIAERMIITLDEIEKATNNFDRARELGGGGHGTVYKGILSSLHVVAIKRSKIVIKREIIEFINEVAILSQINHRNIVKLIGCCLETEVPLLVFEFITNGTLYTHLHVNNGTSLSWEYRLRIAVEIARALAYLHSSISVPILHRDIKSPNILLDDNWTAKLSDFGASRFIPVEQTGIDTVVQGTLGYLDPMYYSTGHFNDKSDVYSFGVLLIELLTRKKPDSYRSPEGFGLVKHFCNLLSEGNVIHILDSQVVDEGGKEVDDVAKLATQCVELRCGDRPTMRQVEMKLEGIPSSKQTDPRDMAQGRLQVNCNRENSVSAEQTHVDQRDLHNYKTEEEPLLSSRYLH
ncbi:unnamed protein product [Urochloa decumbens]|uniref:Protein kinase domain-containing protein n=1 Tax=Urochloa decumbens TaxID=240449 RepID=A0ABC9CZK6_9POAL